MGLKLNFQPVTLSHRSMMESYFSERGGHSCQYTFVSAFGTQGLFGDMVCERDNFLYILRTKRCTSNHRVYLFPSGNVPDKSALRDAIIAVLDDAHSYNLSAQFDTVSPDDAQLIRELFPDRFSIEPSRDYAEYIHRRSDLTEYPGRRFESRRYDYNLFFRKNAGHVSILPITEEHIPDMIDFLDRWLKVRLHSELPEFRTELEAECVGARIWLENFAALRLSGIIVFIDGKICGYAFGAPMYDGYYDELVEKGDSNVEDIYCVLVREFAKRCCEGYEYINREEDCGHPGMRKAKLSYKPAFMLEKFIIREK